MQFLRRRQKAARPGWSPAHEERLQSIQFSLLKRQVPILYAVLAFTALATSAAHYGTAPNWLCLWLLAPLLAAIAGRFVFWMRLAGREFDAQEISRRLAQTTVLGTILAVAFTAWGIALLHYGEGLQPAVTIAFIMITSYGCAFSLACLSRAPFLILTVSGIPFSTALAATGQPSLIMVASIFALVTALTVRMIGQYSEGLEHLVSRQIQLESKHHEVKRAYDLAHEYAYLDSLTGLGNRRSLLRRIETCQSAGQTNLAVMLLDFDHFKMVNDVHGYTGGDVLLRQAGGRLSQAMREGAWAFRLAADEFALVVTMVAHEADAVEFANRVCTTLEEPYQISGSTCLVRVSCGLTLGDAGSDGPEALLDKADKALRDAKRRGICEPNVFSPALHLAAQRRAHVEQALRCALHEDALDVKFQPIVHLADKRVAGFEALARWEDRILGVVSPGEFVEVAEKSGLMDQLTFSLLNKAMRHAATWPRDVYLSFNLSAVDVMRPSTPLRLLGVASEFGVDPRRITVEITETALLHDLAAASRTLEQLHMAGIRIALDDFGTGHASFSNLHGLALDVLKIDRAFIANMAASEKSRIVVRTIVTMCKALGLPVIAEGIETEEQHAALKNMACEYAQGFHYGRPMPASEAWEIVNGADAAAARLLTVGAG